MARRKRMYSGSLYLLWPAVLLLSCLSSNAQVRWFEATAGMAYSYPEAQASPWQHQGRVLPHAGISGYFSFNKTVALKTGLLYQIKGMQSHGRYVPDSIFREESFTARNDYHSLHVPLQLAVSIPGQKGDVWRFAGGMSYGFLLAGYSKVTINSVYEDESEKHRTLAFYHIVALEPKGNHPRAPHEEGTTLNAFTPALRFDLTYLWQERLVLSAFYEYNLQDIRMRTANNSQVRLHYSGIALGVLFW